MTTFFRMISTIPAPKVRTRCMEMIDQLGWTCGFSITHQETRIGFRSNDEELLERTREAIPLEYANIDELEVDILISMLKAEALEDTQEPGYHVMYGGANEVSRNTDIEGLLRSFREYLAGNIFVHSRSHTFITATLLNLESKRVLVLAAPLDIVPAIEKNLQPQEESILIEKWVGVADDAKLSSGYQSLDAAEADLMVFVEAGQNTAPRKLTDSEAILEIISRAPGLQKTPQLGMPRLLRLASSAPAFKLKTGKSLRKLLPSLRELNRRDLAEQ